MKDSPLLDGLTVLRFAHAFESGGGTERYLDDLDRALLARNAMTVVRLHLTRRPPGFSPTEESIGRGRLIHIPLPIIPGEDGNPPAGDEHTLRFRIRQEVRDWGIYNPLVWHTVGARWLASRKLPHQAGQAVGAGLATNAALRRHRIDLVMLHFFGGADAEEVMNEARKVGVPFAILNHYSNDRFLHLAIRKHTMLANGVAGVNGLDLPRYVRHGFTSLSDGIDTDFFHRANAQPLKNSPPQPIILLPARIVREKGQLDLVRAVAMLRQSGTDCCIAFAGRMDSSGFVDELRQEIARFGMTECVHFLGALNLKELRDWYAACAAVALPTYHHEGLPRVILEAQAMETPVVAYAMGGMAEGIASGKTGYLLRSGDIPGLANRLYELISSPPLRSSMGASGREAAEQRFCLSALADRHERFYCQVIKDYKATTHRLSLTKH